MATPHLFGRISSFWPIKSNGICVQLEEQRGAQNVSWELELYNEAELDFECERDGLTLPERSFILGCLLGARQR